MGYGAGSLRHIKCVGSMLTIFYSCVVTYGSEPVRHNNCFGSMSVFAMTMFHVSFEGMFLSADDDRLLASIYVVFTDVMIRFRGYHCVSCQCCYYVAKTFYLLVCCHPDAYISLIYLFC